MNIPKTINAHCRAYIVLLAKVCQFVRMSRGAICYNPETRWSRNNSLPDHTKNLIDNRSDRRHVQSGLTPEKLYKITRSVLGENPSNDIPCCFLAHDHLLAGKVRKPNVTVPTSKVARL